MILIPRLVPSHVPRVILLLALVCSPQALAKKPHIIMIVADDLGWDDVSFHGSSQIPTPALDALANNGVILNNYYVSPLDTPSRASFMTGKYPIHVGLQHDTIHNRQAMGVPLDEKFLPEYLRQQGYKTHAIGKWQLGFFSKEYTPTYRGFDSFYGFWTSNQDYYKHVAYDGGYGLDLRRDMSVVYNETGVYGTELFTREADKVIEAHAPEQPLFIYMAHQAVSVGNMDDPLQAPNRFVDKFPYIKDTRRRTYAGMVAALDESVRQLVTTLKRKGLYQNSVIIFTTDNGAAAGGLDMSAGSNFPLRGVKNTLWEGGVRGVAFVHSPLIKRTGRVYDGLIHATDWMPTIYALAGGRPQSLGPIDGYNVWKGIAVGGRSPRYEVLHGIDPLLGNRASLRVGDYKIIMNQPLKFYSDWYKRPESPHELDYVRKPRLVANASIDCTNKMPHPLLNTHAPLCDPEKKPCLFNIKWDPCEYHNLAGFMPNTLKVMLDRLKFYSKGIKAAIYPRMDDRGNPDNTGGVWIPWRDSPYMDPTVNDFIYPFSYEDQATNSSTGRLLNKNLRKFMRDQSIVYRNETDSAPENSDLTQPLVIVKLTPEEPATTVATAAPQTTQQTTPYVPPTQAPVTQPTTPYVPPTQSTTPYVPPATQSTTTYVPPITQSTTPYVPPVTESTAPYVPPQSNVPYVAPVSETTTPYAPPTQSTTPYVPPTQSTTPYVPPPTQAPVTYAPTQSTLPVAESTTPYAAPVNQDTYGTTSPPPAPQNYTIPTTVAPTQPLVINNNNSYPENFTIRVNFGEPQPPTKDLLQPIVPKPVNQEKPVASQQSLWDHINAFNPENSTNQISTGNVQEVSSLGPPKRPFVFIHKVRPYKTFKHVKPAPGIPEVLDIIDETGRNKLSDAGSGQASIPQIFDIIDEMHGKSSLDRNANHSTIKHKGPTATSKPLSISDVGSGMGVGLNGLPEGVSVFGAMGDKKVAPANENKDRQDVVQISQPIDQHSLHTFFGNITIGGRTYYVVGSESDELARIKTKIDGDRIMVHMPKSQGTRKSNVGYSEMRDRIDLSNDDDDDENDKKPVAKTLAAHNVTSYPLNGQNGTKCEKVVQLDTSDNAVVVSSVVIVVIASAMVVGVAVVAMVAVVARHCQNSSRN